MATLARLDIVISANSTDAARGMGTATRGLQGIERQAQRTERRMLSLGGAFKAAVAVAAVRLLAGATQAVFNLGAAVEETQSKFSVTFAQAAGDVQQFLDTFANSAGLTNREAQDLVSTTGAIAQGMGFAIEESAAYAQQVTRLAADLASFNNVAGGAGEVITAINAAVAGEREQLKRWGIQILDTDVKMRALADTGKRHESQLTQQDKALATLALITQRAGVAVGDLARTQDSAANTARRVFSRLRELREEMASALLPIMAQLLGAMDDSRETMDQLSGAIRGVARFISTGIAVVQLFGVEMAVLGAKAELGWAKVKDAAQDALLTSGIAGFVTKLSDFFHGLPPWLQGLLGIPGPVNPVNMVHGLAALLEEDTALGVTRAENNLSRIVAAAEEAREEILRNLNDALQQQANGPAGVTREDVIPPSVVTDAQKLAEIIARVEGDMRGIAAMEGLAAPLELMKERAAALERGIRAVAEAGLENNEVTAAWVEQLEDLQGQIANLENLAAVEELLRKQAEAAAKAHSELHDVARNLYDDMAERIGRVTTEGKAAFRGFADAVIAELNRIAVRLAIIELVKALAPGNATLLNIVGAPAPRATGGLLTPFKPVKLHRDEVVVPVAPSVAIPASVAARGGGMGGMVVNVSQNFNISAMDGPSVRRVLEQERGTVAAVVLEAVRNSGGYRRQLFHGA